MECPEDDVVGCVGWFEMYLVFSVGLVYCVAGVYGIMVLVQLV